MTKEELEALIKEASEELDKLPDDPEKPLTKKERARRAVLRAQLRTLDKMKEAKEKGNLQQEIQAGVDYALLTKYGEKHPFLMNFIKSQMTWHWF